MELRHLRYFAALAERLSFTRAAAQVHVTQSTLSHQIRQLEDGLGQRLFERVGKRVLLTEAGELLLPSVLRALREIDDGVRALSNGARTLGGELRIASSHTFNINLVPTCLATFLGRHPSVRVTVEELAAVAVERRLHDGAVDLGVAYRPADVETLCFEPLYEEQLVLVVGTEHRWAARKRVRMAELHHQPVALLTPEFTTRRLLDEWFRACGAEPAVVAEMNALTPILGLVRRMEVAAIISEQAMPHDGTLVAIPLESPTPVRVPGLLLRRDVARSAEVKSFVGVLKETVLKTNRQLLANPARASAAAS
jgi:LysR family cyn operon transcriptional activator